MLIVQKVRKKTNLLDICKEESNIPDYDNDPIYSKANPKNLPTYWDIFVESAALYGVDLSDITDVEFISEDLSGGTAGEQLVLVMTMLKYRLMKLFLETLPQVNKFF